MPRHAVRYVGRRAPIWPLGQGPLGVGCATFTWLLLVVGLGLVVFSVTLFPGLERPLLDHGAAVWAGIGVASLAWPFLYLRYGWFRTLLGYWPADDSEGVGVGQACATCGSLMRRGRTVDGYYLCDTCVHQRALDSRRLIAPGVIMVGIAFIGNGVSSLVDYRLRRATGEVGGLLLQWLPVRERNALQTLDLLGAIGSAGLAVAGVLILRRIIRVSLLRPIGTRALNAARRQIVHALSREAAEQEADRPRTEEGPA